MIIESKIESSLGVFTDVDDGHANSKKVENFNMEQGLTQENLRELHKIFLVRVFSYLNIFNYLKGKRGRVGNR